MIQNVSIVGLGEMIAADKERIRATIPVCVETDERVSPRRVDAGHHRGVCP
ncbi:MAG: hypothetical protein HYV96_17050 [Opitutae bacterium]|nr:hypothetical protein [Opitutae bacterium]